MSCFAWTAAANADPFPAGTTLAPANGTRLTPSYQNPPEFVLTSPDTGLMETYVEVSRAPTLGQDGTLANDYVVDQVQLVPSDAAPSNYRGRPSAYAQGWTNTPGTYYVQAQAQKYTSHLDPATGFPVEQMVYFRGPVQRIVVRDATPEPAYPTREQLAMSYYDARRAAGAIIRRRAHAAPRHLHARCARRTYRAFSCGLSWSDRHYRWTGSAAFQNDVTSTLRVATYYQFSGRRMSLACRRHHSTRHCTRRVRW